MAYDQTCPECGEKNWMPEGQFAMIAVRNGGLELRFDATGTIRTSIHVVDVLVCLNCRFVKLFSPV